MVGRGAPKKAQSKKAGLFAMTWYSMFADVRIRGGSAKTFQKDRVNTRHILSLQCPYPFCFKIMKVCDKLQPTCLFPYVLYLWHLLVTQDRRNTPASCSTCYLGVAQLLICLFVFLMLVNEGFI